jgi:excisionase family DNA binding protein
MKLEPEEINAIAEAVVAKLEGRLSAPNGNRLLSVDVAAQMLGRSKDAVYMLINRGRLASVKEGRRVHVELSELERFIDRNRDAA